MATTKTLPDGSVVTLPAYSDTADIAVITTDMTNIVDNITTLSNKINATDLGTLTSLSALQTALNTQVSSMKQNDVKAVEFYVGSTAFETFNGSERYIGHLKCTYVSSTRRDFIVTFESGSGDSVSIGRLNGKWSYNDVNSQTVPQVVSQLPYASGVYYLSTSLTIDGVQIPAYTMYVLKFVTTAQGGDITGVAVNVGAGSVWSLSGTRGAFAKCIRLPSADNLTHRRIAGTYTDKFQVGVYGYVTTSGTIANLYWPLILQQNVSTVEITNITIAIRVAGGGYLVGNNANVTQYVTNVSTRLAQGLIQIDLQKSDGFGITNNTPVIGTANITYTVS